MKNIKTKSTVSYKYAVGDTIVHGSTSSNYVDPFLRDVVISIKKNCDQTYFKPGDILNYDIIVSNIGTYLAEFININESIKSQTLIVDSIKLSSLDNIDFKYQDAIDGVDFIIKSLNPNETVHIAYQTIVDEIIDPHQNIISVSEVEVDDQDLMYTNPIEIEQKYARIICEAETAPYIYPNKDYQYILTITNIGNTIAEDVEISSQLPSSYALESINIDEEVCEISSINDNVLKFIIGSIDADESKTVTITGRIQK